MTYKVWKTRDKQGRPLTRSVHVGTVQADTPANALATFLATCGYYKAEDLVAEPAKRAA
jgi:hypothetical protein